MQNLRRNYKKLQQESNKSYQRLTKGHFETLLKACNSQYQTVISSDDYTNLDELVFYRQRLQDIIDGYQGFSSKKTLKNNIKTILKDSYLQHQGPIHLGDDQTTRRPQTIEPYSLGRQDKRQLTPKQVISSFFQKKKEEVEKSKTGFDSILKDLPKSPHKIKVKSSKMPSSLINQASNEQQQLSLLKNELQRLKRQLQIQKNKEKMQQNMIQADKRQRQKKINSLINKIQALKRQNSQLKDLSDIQKNPKTQARPNQRKQLITDYQYPRTYSSRQSELNQSEIHQYNMLYKQNDTGVIKKKTKSPKDIKDKHKLLNQSRQQYNKLKNNPIILTEHQLPIQPYKSFGLQRKKSDSILQASNLRFNRSEVEDQAKNIAIRSKISYFKPSMILYRCDSFDIAVKSSSIKPLCQKKVRIFINNKSYEQLNAQITYKYDRNYFNLSSIKKIQKVNPKQQQRQQINIALLNQIDLDSVIQVQLIVDARTLNFLLPVIFLQFVDKRPKDKRKIENKCESINPIHQFSTFQLASEILPLQIVQNELYQTGRVYAISKYHQGYIYLRWINKLLQIETIPQWKLFVSYLMLKDY